MYGNENEKTATMNRSLDKDYKSNIEWKKPDT